MEEHLRHLSIQIYRLRKRASLTQKQMADRLHVAQPYIAMLESGRADREPSLSFLLAVSTSFNVGIDDLLGTGDRQECDPLSALSERDRDLIEPLLIRLARSEKTDRHIDLSNSIRAVGSDLVLHSEVTTGVELAPQIPRRGISAHAIQEELFQLT